jgi:hypothetical protein
MKKCFLFLVFCGCLVQIQAQQAWPRGKGKYYAQIGFSYLTYNSLLNGNEPLRPLNRTVQDATLQAYVEYGLSDKWTLTGILPLKYASVKSDFPAAETNGSLIGLSNSTVAASYTVYNKYGIVASLKATGALNTASYSYITGLRTGFDAWAFAPSLAVGYGHPKFFTSFELGYALRTNGYANRQLAGFQLGKKLGKAQKFMAIAGLEYVKTENGGTYDDATSVVTGLYLQNQSYVSPNLRFAYSFKPTWHVWLGLGGGVGDITRNVAAAPGLTISVSKQSL